MSMRERITGVATSRESLALGVGTLAFLVAGCAAAIAFGTHDQPISGPGSLGQFAAIASAITAFAVFAGTWLLAPSRPLGERTIVGMLVDLIALAIAHAVVCLLLWLVLTWVAEESFKGAIVYALPAVALAALAAAISAYVAFLSARGMTGMRLSGVLAAFLVLGAITSMLSATDPHWWQENLSALGMTDDLSAFAFNLTLIVAGVLVTTIARYATAAVNGGNRVGVLIVRWALVALGVLLACVGIFPVDRFFVVHNSVACGMVVAFLVITIGMRWFIPEIPRAFVALGLVLLVLILVVGVFFAVGRYNLTAVELVAAVAIFGWLIVFLRTVSATASDADAAQASAESSTGRHARADIDLSDLDDPAAALALADLADDDPGDQATTTPPSAR